MSLLFIDLLLVGQMGCVDGVLHYAKSNIGLM
jgi:hypothetical protein